MNDILCNDGCLLKHTMSPSCKDLSTVQPTSIFTVFLLIHDISILELFGLTTNLTMSSKIKFFKYPILYDVTLIGMVRVFAIDLGIPTSCIPKLSSPVMTDLAVKSHRLPIRFPRILPSFFFCLLEYDVYSLLDERMDEFGSFSLSINPVTAI